MTIDLNNVINVSLTAVPSGLSDFNINSVGLFSTETPDNLDSYRIYINSRDVATDYGTNSVTYAMANAIFSQSPNILSGSGRLVIMPMQSSVSATQGNFTTTNITANLTGILLITDGRIRITVNGVINDLSGIDFTNATTFADVATILQKKLPNAIVEATLNGFKITSKKVGTASTVAMGVNSGTGTNLAGSSYFNSTSGTAVAGANSSGETIVNAMARIGDSVQYGAVFTNLQIEDTVYVATSTAVQAMDKIFIHQSVSTEDVAGVCTTIKAANNFKTKCLLYTIGLTEANLYKAAYVGRAFSVNFSGSSTSQTMFLKSLSTILPDNGINQTTYSACQIAGVDTYDNYGIAGVTSNSFDGNGKFFDDVYNDLWFKLALQIAGFNFLATTNTKVPQTELGMDGLKGAYKKVCELAVFNGVLGKGLTWNSSETFGNPEDLKRNVTDAGYFIYSLPIAQQSQIDRAQRIAPLVQIAAKRSGAIQHSDVIGVIEA